jgi:hypothetical protein
MLLVEDETQREVVESLKADWEVRAGRPKVFEIQLEQ